MLVWFTIAADAAAAAASAFDLTTGFYFYYLFGFNSDSVCSLSKFLINDFSLSSRFKNELAKALAEGDKELIFTY